MKKKRVKKIIKYFYPWLIRDMNIFLKNIFYNRKMEKKIIMLIIKLKLIIIIIIPKEKLKTISKKEKVIGFANFVAI